MILVDTSVWIDHLRHGVGSLRELLEDGQVLAHDYVIAELACGHLPKRQEFLEDLKRLPRAAVASNDELLAFIEAQSLMGTGLSFVDMHLLAATQLHEGARLWSYDKRLQLALVAGRH